MMAAQTGDCYSNPIIHLPEDLQGKQIIQLYMYFVHLHLLIFLRSNKTFVCKNAYINSFALCKPIKKLAVHAFCFLYIFVIFAFVQILQLQS